MAIDLNGRSIRTATVKDKQFNVGTGSFNMYAYEYEAAVEGQIRFYVATVRALTMTEAKLELDLYLRKQNQTLVQIVRKYDHGRDSSWKQGTRNSWVKGSRTQTAGVVEVRMYDRELFERLRNA